MVSTLDSESSDLSSSLGGTFSLNKSKGWTTLLNILMLHNLCEMNASQTHFHTTNICLCHQMSLTEHLCPAEHSNMATWKAITQQCPASMAMPKSDNWNPTSMNALSGNRSQVNCLEGSYANHYTTNSRKLPSIMKFKWVKANELSNMI